MSQVGSEALGIIFQDRRAVAFWVGGDCQQQIVLNLFFVKRPLDRSKLGGQQRADIGTGGKDKGDQDQFAARRGEAKRFAVLVGKLEIGHRRVDQPSADVAGLLERYRNMRKARRWQ